MHLLKSLLLVLFALILIPAISIPVSRLVRTERGEKFFYNHANRNKIQAKAKWESMSPKEKTEYSKQQAALLNKVGINAKAIDWTKVQEIQVYDFDDPYIGYNTFRCSIDLPSDFDEQVGKYRNMALDARAGIYVLVRERRECFMDPGIDKNLPTIFIGSPACASVARQNSAYVDKYIQATIEGKNYVRGYCR